MSDIIASVCVGIGQVLVGHPFDTSKVLIQNNRKWIGLPLMHYYRGWKYPLLSSIIFNIIVFPINERLYKKTENYFFSGLVAGICVTPGVYIFNNFKIQNQVNKPLTFDVLKKGRGLLGCLYRESLAMSSYFGSYNYAKDLGYNSIIAGGFAGLVNWTITYPIDVIVSRQMAQNISIYDAYKQGHLWKGYSICATRAIMVNAVNFTIYEQVRRVLE